MLLDEIVPGTRVDEIALKDVIDMKQFLLAAMDTDDTRLRAVPEILAVKFPQYLRGGEDGDDRTWIDDETPEARLAVWTDGLINLTECCAEGCPARDQTVYRHRVAF